MCYVTFSSQKFFLIKIKEKIQKSLKSYFCYSRYAQNIPINSHFNSHIFVNTVQCSLPTKQPIASQNKNKKNKHRYIVISHLFFQINMDYKFQDFPIDSFTAPQNLNIFQQKKDQNLMTWSFYQQIFSQNLLERKVKRSAGTVDLFHYIESQITKITIRIPPVST